MHSVHIHTHSFMHATHARTHATHTLGMLAAVVTTMFLSLSPIVVVNTKAHWLSLSRSEPRVLLAETLLNLRVYKTGRISNHRSRSRLIHVMRLFHENIEFHHNSSGWLPLSYYIQPNTIISLLSWWTWFMPNLLIYYRHTIHHCACSSHSLYMKKLTVLYKLCKLHH